MRKEETTMYARNTIARRRASGWADRRSYYRRLLEQSRPKDLQRGEEARKASPVSEKD
jgi:hypothetical protein